MAMSYNLAYATYNYTDGGDQFICVFYLLSCCTNSLYAIIQDDNVSYENYFKTCFLISLIVFIKTE